ncbi:methyltransferase domain-containing protein [Streptomyces sp. BHT-5-2]|uniref:methyltransferase domain-containing protein n=1 Tax=Streptomyces sp. BHT-5-2 TaxID=2866715 RepID=UPI001C8D7266|nr:methyltransferase domain-containing protein [Streptomyces sp. BHT-5-2]QZL04342.1 methyltransferase domain-containing protein [Streptomyces sp. BHT-5-2]
MTVAVDRPGRRRLARSLLDAGALRPEWEATFTTVDRAMFLPDVMWPWDMMSRASNRVDKATDADAWHAAADADQPIVTQWDDGRHTRPGPGMTATSSSSMPSVVYRLLGDLDVDEGMRVLDNGTGTGETAGALTHRCGSGKVTTIEVDAEASQQAAQRLNAAGLHPTVVVGDGTAGDSAHGPYDRILVTYGLREVPGALVEQTRPGGLIVAPWGTHYSNADAVVHLTVQKAAASGRFTSGVEFMKSRSQRRTAISPSDYVPSEGVRGADTSRTSVTEEQFASGRFGVLPFVLGLRVRDCTQAVADKRDGARPVWFYGLSDRSWACVLFRDDRAEARVWQSGPRRLWDEVEAAYHWWTAQASPGFDRFGLTVTPDGQQVWLDEPANSWPA